MANAFPRSHGFNPYLIVHYGHCLFGGRVAAKPLRIEPGMPMAAFVRFVDDCTREDAANAQIPDAYWPPRCVVLAVAFPRAAAMNRMGNTEAEALSRGLAGRRAQRVSIAAHFKFYKRGISASNPSRHPKQ